MISNFTSRLVRIGPTSCTSRKAPSPTPAQPGEPGPDRDRHPARLNSDVIVRARHAAGRRERRRIESGWSVGAGGSSTEGASMSSWPSDGQCLTNARLVLQRDAGTK